MKKGNKNRLYKAVVDRQGKLKGFLSGYKSREILEKASAAKLKLYGSEFKVLSGLVRGEKDYSIVENKILKLLCRYSSPLTVRVVASEVEISYPTAKKYLSRLVEQNLVLRRKKLDGFELKKGDK